MRVMIGPGQWRDDGPQAARAASTPTGYQLSESPLPTLESVGWEEPAPLKVGKRKVIQTTGRKGYLWRKVRDIQ